MTLVKDNADKPIGSKSQKASNSSVDSHVVTCNKLPISQYVSMPSSQSEAKISTGKTQRKHDHCFVLSHSTESIVPLKACFVLLKGHFVFYATLLCYAKHSAIFRPYFSIILHYLIQLVFKIL